MESDSPTSNTHKKSKCSHTYVWQNRFQCKKVAKDKNGHFIIIKGTLYQEDIRLYNIYSHHQGTLKYITQLLTEIKGENDKKHYHIWGP